MNARRPAIRVFSLLLVSVLLLANLPASAALPAQESTITIDGAKEAAWGDPLALDPAGDMSEGNLDLTGLYVAEDAGNFYIGFDAFASTWGMTYGIYIDTDQVGGSGATSDPWSRAVAAVPAHLPEHTLYVWHNGGGYLEEAQLNHWSGSGWSYDSLVSQGGEQAYGPDAEWIEYRVPKAALGSPSRIALELFTTGGDGHAQDTVPSDGGVAYTEPDWSGDWTTLAAFVLFPPPEWYVRGDWDGWGAGEPMFDDGAHGDSAASDGIYGALLSLSEGYHRFRVATADWPPSYPGSGDSWLDAPAGGSVTVTFDTNAHADGWLPDSNIIGVDTAPEAWTAVGDWQGWNNANPSTEMVALGEDLYRLVAAIPSPGDYQYKAVRTGTWDAVGADGRGVNAATLAFSTAEPGQIVTFTVSALAGRARVEVAPIPPVPHPDGDIWWDGLGHDSRSDLYRVPGGAVTTGTPVTVRLRTFHDDVTEVSLRVWSTTAGAQTLYPMQLVASTPDAPYGYDYWQATIPAQASPTILYYRFIVRDGADEDYYEDDDLFDGGWGQVYEESPDYSFQIDVYDPAFQTPEWMQNAVVYQIFPDRFYNGDTRNDPGADDASVYGNDVRVNEWGEPPEGYCRGYQGVDCAEEPLGRDFYGGDLAGITQKLGYLRDLGVTAIYLNPIFMAPSNHLYDTTDYRRIDPYLGTTGDFQKLIQQARRAGIHVILDGVFNHTSSDSIYFDRYSRYAQRGAYESQDSAYYGWYTFTNWPDQYNSWWGFDSMPVLTEAPEVRDFIYGADDSVARRWIDMGAAGWRLDVAPDKSHEWWQEFRPQIKEVDPDAVILGEIWDDASLWLLGDEFDSTMNYRFRRALIGFVNGETNDPNQGVIRGLNPDQFDAALQGIREDYPPQALAAAMNLVGTHDTQRILWVLTPGARNPEAKVENEANLAEGKAKLELLAILQMTLPGAPTIFYGDEAGLTGDTDPDCRQTYPWEAPDEELLTHYQTLIRARNDHSFLRTGSYDRLFTNNGEGTYAYGRKDATGAAIVAVNRDAAAHTLAIPVGGYIPDGTVLTDALGGATYPVTDGQVQLELAGRGGAVLVTPEGADLTPPAAPTGLTASPGNGTVGLTWDAVPGAAGYYVYRSYVSGGGYARLNDAPLAATAYDDSSVTNGCLYYYTVAAADDLGNESARSGEVEALPHLVIGWANLQSPPSIAHTVSALDPTADIYGQVWIDGATADPGATEGLAAQVGYGPDGYDPAAGTGWTWVDASYNADTGNNDEFVGRLLPEAPGSYDYCFRYTTTGGHEWVYADLDGTGNGYDPAQAGTLTVHAAADTTPPAVPTNLRLVEAAPGFIRLAWDPIPDADLYRYEVFRGTASGGPYECLARVAATEYTDWNVTADSTYFYVARAVDTAFNRSGDSAELSATASPRPVQVTFSVTLPETTPDGDDIYIGASFNGWTGNGTLMARSGLAATVTLTFDEGTHIEYKYTHGSWTYVEKGAACEELANRVATVVYGASGTMTLTDTVLNWRNTGTCPD